MHLPEEQSTLEEASSHIARKNSGLAVSSVTPSPKKANSGVDQFIDETFTWWNQFVYPAPPRLLSPYVILSVIQKNIDF
jgi:hypothetical protein